jgi:hypothetical protein
MSEVEVDEVFRLCFALAPTVSVSGFLSAPWVTKLPKFLPKNSISVSVRERGGPGSSQVRLTDNAVPCRAFALVELHYR